MNEHLNPDEIAMKERAEKATDGPWSESHSGDFGMAVHEQVLDADGLEVAESVRGSMQCVIRTPEDQHNSNQVRQGRRDFEFIAAARTDLPTILARLANERAKLAIAIEALNGARLAIRQGAEQETRNIIEDALARINELEKQHGKT